MSNFTSVGRLALCHSGNVNENPCNNIPCSKYIHVYTDGNIARISVPEDWQDICSGSSETQDTCTHACSEEIDDHILDLGCLVGKSAERSFFCSSFRDDKSDNL